MALATNDRRRTLSELWPYVTASSGTAPVCTSTYATGASARGAGASGNTPPIVVVKHPEKKAGTPIDVSRWVVVQSRQPTGP